LLNPRLPFTRSSYYPPSLIEKYASSSYRSYKSGGLVGYAAKTDPTESAPFTFNTNINVHAGDVIVTFQWEAVNDNLGNTIAPRDNLGSKYTELSGGDQYLGGSYICGTTESAVGLGGAYYAVAAGSGTLSVTFNWIYPPDDVPGYAIYVFHGAQFNGNIYFQPAGNQSASSGSASITTSGLAKTTYHYALIAAYVSNNPCLNAVSSLSAQGFKSLLTWGDTCYYVCVTSGPTLSDALYYAYKYSAQDFTFNLQFTYAGTTLYGYAIALV
jgi:hypothetical protein